MQKLRIIARDSRLVSMTSVERIIGSLAAFSLLTLLTIYTFKKSVFFTSIPIDGAFQHLNPLRRIADGEVPGVDFQVFHGLVISYLHYPVYALLGKDLFASEFSRYFINGLCSFIAVGCVFFGLKKTSVALGLSIFFIVSTGLAELFWLVDPLGDAYSSLAVRTLMPAAVIGYLFYVNRTGLMRPDNTLTRVVLPMALSCAVTMVIATEQGIALFLAVSGALLFIHPGRPKPVIALRDTVLFWLLMPVFYYVLVFAITHGEPGKAIRFYFSELPADQFWYFGAYPNIFPKDFASLLFVPGTRRPFTSYVIVGVALAVLLVSFFKTRDEHYKNECRIWMLALAYGSATLISNLGMISSHYSEAITRMACIFLIFYVWNQIDARFTLKAVAWFKVGSLAVMLAVILFSPFRFSGVIPSGIALFSEYRASVLEKRYSGVVPRGAEYQNLFSITSAVLPPKSLMGAQQGAVRTDEGYLTFHHPPPLLTTLMREGSEITINGRNEYIRQVSRSHLLYTYNGHEQVYDFRYINPKLAPRVLSTTPLYSKKSGIWINGIAGMLFNKGGCLMIRDSLQLANVTEYRTVRFASEGGDRHVTSVYENIICVDGPPLEPYVHGFPVRFTVNPAIEFSSSQFDLVSRSSRAIGNVAQWLYEAEAVSRSGEPRDENDPGLFKTRLSAGGYMLRLSSLSKRKNTQSRYFEQWPSAPCASDQKPTLWSTYTGFLELQENTVNESGTDYIIHALGARRRAEYLNSFIKARPTFVHTLRSSYSAYERWIQTATWRFYEVLLANYDVVATTDYSLIWRRKTEQPVDEAWIDNPQNLCRSQYAKWVDAEPQWDGALEVRPGDQLLDLSRLAVGSMEQQQVYVIEIDYVIDNKIQSIPVIGKVARYFLSPVATMTPLPVSLPPYETTVLFPIVVSPGQSPALKLENASLFGQSSFSVTAVRYRKVVENAGNYKKAMLDYK